MELFVVLARQLQVFLSPGCLPCHIPEEWPVSQVLPTPKPDFCPDKVSWLNKMLENKMQYLECVIHIRNNFSLPVNYC